MITVGLEHYKNKMQTYLNKKVMFRFVCPELALLWLRHAAGRVVRPVAVEADDAPFHAPARSDHAEILADPVMDRAGAGIRHHGDATAIAAGNGILGPAPRAKGGFADAVDRSEERRVGKGGG